MYVPVSHGGVLAPKQPRQQRISTASTTVFFGAMEKSVLAACMIHATNARHP